MPDKHFGKGFASKHFAQKHFATTSIGREVNASTAVVAVTGLVASVLRGTERVVPTATAHVVVTTQRALVSRGRTALCSTAEIVVTPQPATVLVGGRRVEAACAVLAIQALPASVSRGRIVRAAAAAIVVTAQPATIVRGGTVGWLAAKVAVFPEHKLAAKSSGIYLGNDSAIQLLGLVDRDDQSITNADVRLVSFVDEDGATPAGISLPTLMNNVGGGDYEAALPKGIALTPGRLYRATVRAVSGSITGEWTETVLAMRRAA